jgi:hypothetical protein
MEFIICNWSTYNTHCRRNIKHTDKCINKFCSLHKELMEEYKKFNDSDELCETFQEIKIVPRSYKHIKSVMSSINNEDDTVQVYMSGGLIEDADITCSEYIELLSDNCRYYYNPRKGQNKVKDLKVILKRYCDNNCIVSVGDIKYCENCYKKLKNVPKLSVIIDN